MEKQLTALERKIDDLLASVDEQGAQVAQSSTETTEPSTTADGSRKATTHKGGP